MTREECAAELYELIVVKGRWKGKPATNIFSDGSYASLPEWMQELWLLKADEFADQNRFKLLEG